MCAWTGLQGCGALLFSAPLPSLSAQDVWECEGDAAGRCRWRMHLLVGLGQAWALATMQSLESGFCQALCTACLASCPLLCTHATNPDHPAALDRAAALLADAPGPFLQASPPAATEAASQGGSGGSGTAGSSNRIEEGPYTPSAALDGSTDAVESSDPQDGEDEVGCAPASCSFFMEGFCLLSPKICCHHEAGQGEVGARPGRAGQAGGPAGPRSLCQPRLQA